MADLYSMGTAVLRTDLDRARRSHPQHEWVQAEIAAWSMGAPNECDVVFSNAALHWVEDHAAVYPRLFAREAAGGVLAIQAPFHMNEAAHRIMRDLAASHIWRERFPPGGVREWLGRNSIRVPAPAGQPRALAIPASVSDRPEVIAVSTERPARSVPPPSQLCRRCATHSGASLCRVVRRRVSRHCRGRRCRRQAPA